MATRTSKFGVSKREGHDSSSFYKSRLYSTATGCTAETGLTINPFPTQHMNRIYCRDSRDLSFLPDNCLHLMVTSPPYNVGKEYDADLSLDEYILLVQEVMREIYRILIPGGRACINIANVGRKPYIPLNMYVTEMMIQLGFLMRGEIIWNKAASSGSSTAWGSWCSASNPSLRDVHEYIMVFSKGTFSRPKGKKESTISKEEFLEYTRSIWTFKTESARRVAHPAPFPVELPYRLIQLYTYRNDIIIDPFCGSGTSCIAALQTGRNFIAADIEEDYVLTARKRVENYLGQGKDDIKTRRAGKKKRQ